MNRGLPIAEVFAGLIAAPLAWMVSVQLGQILPYVDCAYRIHTTAICAAVGAAVALIAAALSWRRSAGASLDDGQPHRFFGSVAGLTALAISFALLLQLLLPCER